MNAISELYQSLDREVGKVIVGQKTALRLIVVALVSEGHVLLEGVPGLAKTTIVRALSAALGLEFRRLQFTPDLMPSDVIGTQIFDFQQGKFHLVQGPVFTNILLADEINRSPAKTQSALLEAMQERQVSIEGTAKHLPQPFLVIATENPVEYEGTYPLPEAQLDRFLFKILLDYPSAEEELTILKQHRGDNAGLSELLGSVDKVADADVLRQAKEESMSVSIQPAISKYIIEIVRRTRNDENIQLGGSPRASLYLQVAARTLAALEGRDYVIPDDVKELVFPVLRHRILLTASSEVEGLGADEVLRVVVNSVPVPR